MTHDDERQHRRVKQDSSLESSLSIMIVSDGPTDLSLCLSSSYLDYVVMEETNSKSSKKVSKSIKESKSAKSDYTTMKPTIRPTPIPTGGANP
jgi:hypothetical protein